MTGCVKTNGFEMEYFTFGNGKKQFVIIPGMSLKSVMLSSEAVKAAYSPFTDGFTVTLFDRKKNIASDYPVSDMADDTAVAMKYLGIKDAFAFGASQGGMILQFIAARHPELIKKAVLSSTIVKNRKTGKETFSEWMAFSASKDRVSLNRSVFSKVYSEGYREKYRDVIKSLENSGTDEEMLRFYYLSKASLEFDSSDEAGNIKCPVLVTGSEKDLVLGSEGGRDIAQKAGAALYMYGGFSHAVYDEAPDHISRIFSFFGENS